LITPHNLALTGTRKTSGELLTTRRKGGDEDGLLNRH